MRPDPQLDMLVRYWPVMLASCFTILAIVGLFVAGTVQYFMKLQYSKKTWPWALIYILAAVPLPLINAMLIFAKPASELPNPQLAGFVRVVAVVAVVFGLGLAVAAGLVFTAGGMYSARKLKQPAFPLVRSLFRAARRRAPRVRRFPWVPAVVAGGGFLIYTALLFAATSPRVSPVLEKAVQN
ncbi:MAG: hypothetical protein ACYTGB_02930, partial [Planctomycetota bacterium]